VNLKLSFENAKIAGLVLAKVGNPSREEPLQTSKQIFQVEEDDQAMLSAIFMRPFKSLSLVGHRFRHHSSLSNHELNTCVASIFEDSDQLLKAGCDIAQRLYSKSSHPNIKSGDLCVALVEGIDVGEDQTVRGICILKSESVSPFLSITPHEGDLQLNTEHGINPEKIDKGCLVIDQFERKGYYSLTFDRAGNESRFWVRDFLSVAPIPDSSLLSKRVAEMAVQAVTPEVQPEEEDDSPPWAVNDTAKEALSYFDDKKQFSLQEFEEQALRTPEAKAKFREEKKRLEEEEGVKIEEGFDISKKDVVKAKKLMKNFMRLDSGVEIKLKPKVVNNPDAVLEKGYDEEKKKNFIKIYFNKDLA